VPFETEVTPAARSRKNGILLVCGALGYIATFGAIAGIATNRHLGRRASVLPAIGIGYFIDFHTQPQRSTFLNLNSFDLSHQVLSSHGVVASAPMSIGAEGSQPRISPSLSSVLPSLLSSLHSSLLDFHLCTRIPLLLNCQKTDTEIAALRAKPGHRAKRIRGKRSQLPFASRRGRR